MEDREAHRERGGKREMFISRDNIRQDTPPLSQFLSNDRFNNNTRHVILPENYVTVSSKFRRHRT